VTARFGDHYLMMIVLFYQYMLQNVLLPSASFFFSHLCNSKMMCFNAETVSCWRHRHQQKPFRFVCRKVLRLYLP